MLFFTPTHTCCQFHIRKCYLTNFFTLQSSPIPPFTYSHYNYLDILYRFFFPIFNSYVLIGQLNYTTSMTSFWIWNPWMFVFPAGLFLCWEFAMPQYLKTGKSCGVLWQIHSNVGPNILQYGFVLLRISLIMHTQCTYSVFLSKDLTPHCCHQSFYSSVSAMVLMNPSCPFVIGLLHLPLVNAEIHCSLPVLLQHCLLLPFSPSHCNHSWLLLL